MSSSIQFGPFSVDFAGGQLLRHGRSLEIQRKPFEVLAVLAERAGELVTREQLYARLWPNGTHVDYEHGLNTAVRKLRRALGEDSGTPRFVETVAGRGYRFHAEVEPAKVQRGCVLALRMERSGEALSTQLGAAIALWRGELVEREPSGMTASFASADDAVRCAVGLAQRARAGAALEGLCIGLGAGLTSWSEALALCDAAAPGEALAAASLIGALASLDGLDVRDHAPVIRAGATPLAVVAVEASALPRAELLGRPPFVGRRGEVARLTARLEESASGRGSLVLISGEPGIGKTRLIEEVAAEARRAGTVALIGRCKEDGASFHQPLADALEPYLFEKDREELRRIIPLEAAAVAASVVPTLRERLGKLPDVPSLRGDEAQLRAVGALAQTFAAIARNAPVLLALDDLHWADSFTLRAVGHLARVAAQAPLLIVGSHRDTPPEAGTFPLARMLDQGALRVTESVALGGLDATHLLCWLEAVAPGRSTAASAAEVERASGGNPFFVRELVLAWAGRLRNARDAREARLDVDAGAVPGGILELIAQRLTALSDGARRLLTAASAAGAVFRFDVVARVAGLEEDPALDALDEGYDARLVRSGRGVDESEFFHALTRQVLYAAIAPARRVRLHRRLAKELSRAGGAHPAEVAEHYHRSRELPGAEPGAEFALEAASNAESSAGFDGAARLLRIALDLLPPADPRRACALQRLGLAKAWIGAADEAAELALEASAAIAAAEGSDAAAEALADAADALYGRSYHAHAGALAARGLEHKGDECDLTWMRLGAHRVLALEATNPELAMLPTDTPLRREVSRGLLEFCGDVPPQLEGDLYIFDSRADAIRLGSHMPGVRLSWIGDYRGALPIYCEQIRIALARGQLGVAMDRLSAICHCELALGNLAAADEALARAEALAQRTEPSTFLRGVLPIMALFGAIIRGEGIAEALAKVRQNRRIPSLARSYVAGTFYSMAGAAAALAGRGGEALQLLELAMPAVEKGPAWGPRQAWTIANAVEIAWLLGAQRHLALLESCLREKTLAPDFRYPNTDARLSLARLRALAGDCEQASEWFAKARSVLDEQHARPLRAIADLDEASMYLRRAACGDRRRALPLLDAAVEQFDAIGMRGWIRRAESLASA